MSRREAREVRVRKTFNLPADLIRRVQRIYGTRTETEALVRCLQDATFMDDVLGAVRRTAGKSPDFDPLR